MRLFQVRSETSRSRFYEVKLHDDGVYTCSCPHFNNKQVYRNEYCKHINKVIKFLNLNRNEKRTNERG